MNPFWRIFLTAIAPENGSLEDDPFLLGWCIFRHHHSFFSSSSSSSPSSLITHHSSLINHHSSSTSLATRHSSLITNHHHSSLITHARRRHHHHHDSRHITHHSRPCWPCWLSRYSMPITFFAMGVWSHGSCGEVPPIEMMRRLFGSP